MKKSLLIIFVLILTAALLTACVGGKDPAKEISCETHEECEAVRECDEGYRAVCSTSRNVCVCGSLR